MGTCGVLSSEPVRRSASDRSWLSSSTISPSGLTPPSVAAWWDRSRRWRTLLNMSRWCVADDSGPSAPGTSSVDTDSGLEPAPDEIEFTTAEGDVADLIPVTWNLTGTEAVAHIREYTKGSEARGDALALSFATPLECSESQVTSGACGEEVTYYELQTSSTASFEGEGVTTYTIDTDPTVQFVRISSALFEGRDDDYESPAVSGFFRLSYGGAVTNVLGADATATTVRHELEALPGAGALNVSRTYSRAEYALATCSAETGSPTLTCDDLATEDAPQPSDLIYLDGDWYTVADSYDPSSPTSLPLALSGGTGPVRFAFCTPV